MKKIIFIALSFLAISCSKENLDFRAQNEAEIVQYLNDSDLIAQKSTSGLHYIIDEPGTGTPPSASSNVTVAYKGYFLDGRVFDESSASGLSFGLQQVIPGWTEGIQYFREGGSGILFVPSHLGYGSSDTRGIPGGSVLIFEVRLISVN